MAAKPQLAAVCPPSGRLTVAASTTVPLPGVRVDPQITRAVVGAAIRLRQAGHDIARADPPYSQATANAIVAWYTAATADETAALDQTRLEPRQRRHPQIGRTLQRLGMVRQSDRDRWKDQAAQFFSSHDVLLTPVMTAMPPAAAGWRDRPWLSNFWVNARWVPYPGAWNFAQYPAATVPVAMHSNGMPIGVQLVAPPGGEALLLSIAQQLQALRPWPRHAPLAGLD